MKTPKASFVIPAYNAHSYIAQAILSCRGQSVKDIEIIVVDNGSTDGTQELVNWHKEQDDRVILATLDKPNRSAARNHGNALARSPFIFVLDADDRSMKHRVRDCLSVFNTKNPDIIYGPSQLIDEIGNSKGKIPAGPFNKELSLKRKFNFILHSTMAYRKGVTLNVQYDEGEYSQIGLDDWKFQWECVLKGYKFGICPTMLSEYREREGNTEASRDPKEVERLKNEFLDHYQTEIARA